MILGWHGVCRPSRKKRPALRLAQHGLRDVLRAGLVFSASAKDEMMMLHQLFDRGRCVRRRLGRARVGQLQDRRLSDRALRANSNQLLIQLFDCSHVSSSECRGGASRTGALLPPREPLVSCVAPAASRSRETQCADKGLSLRNQKRPCSSSARAKELWDAFRGSLPGTRLRESHPRCVRSKCLRWMRDADSNCT